MGRTIINLLREHPPELAPLNAARLRLENWIWARFEATPPGECHYCGDALAEGETRHHAECWKDSL